jgi:hypothetical protein
MAQKRRSTGYYDINGREIREGDIVKVGNLEGAVTYDERLDLFFFGILPYERMNTKSQREIEIIGQTEKPEGYVSVLH